MSEKQQRRKIRNKINNPLLQMKIGLYCIILSLIFSFSVLTILFLKFRELIGLILDLTDAQDTLGDIISTYWSDTQIWVIFALMTYIISTIIICILYTHRLIGPTIAFRRHIEKLIDGDYDAHTQVRRGDAFNELAEVLNALSKKLKTASVPKE